MTFKTLILCGVAVVAAACSQQDRGTASNPAPAAPAPVTVAPSPEVAETLSRINGAGFVPTSVPDASAAPDAVMPQLIRVQVWLARRHVSPGVIDGRSGSNLREAIKAFQEDAGMTVDGQVNQALWDALASDAAPTMAAYVVTAADVAGPFTPVVPTEIEQQATLPALGYRDPVEMLAERFQMDEGLLRALNPGADFSRAGTTLVVTAIDGAPIAAVDRIEVSKAEGSVRAFDEAGKLVAYFPATVGSTDKPSPHGEMTVNGVARNPTYTYDPARVNYARQVTTKLIVRPGPNNPVGAVWIDLSKDTYGIHGTPEPINVGKTASHGCVRLTNWNALALAAAVRPGVRVRFR